MSNKDQFNDGDSIKLKIAVVGKSLGGKSSLIYRFVNNSYREEHDATIEDIFKINYEFNGMKCVIELIDTAGQQDYESIQNSCIAKADGVLLVYSIEDTDSFEKVKERVQYIKSNKFINKSNNIGEYLVVFGNKTDLNGHRKILFDDAFNFLRVYDVDLVEGSAKNNINVKNAFMKLFDKLITRKLNPEEQENREKKGCLCW